MIDRAIQEKTADPAPGAYSPWEPQQNAAAKALGPQPKRVLIFRSWMDF